MSVLIKGMTLPQNCFYCEIMHKTEDGEWMKCPLAGFKYRMHDMYTYVSELTQPHSECPLVALPDKHGDLIDRDEVRNAVFHHLSIKGEENLLPAEKSIFGNLIKAKAVIEAEDSE